MTVSASPKARYALLSVSDKAGLIPFAQRLKALGFVLLSTGGTAQALREAGLEVVEVSQYTGSDEVLGGRVKTLHPAIHAGILAKRDDPDHVAQLQERGLHEIELVVVNLYPFVQVVSDDPELPLAQAIEQIDIGGPTMLRAAAKNHAHVGVVVEPAQYEEIAQALARDGRLDEPMRQALALKAFRHTAAYDAAIVAFLQARFEPAEAIPAFEAQALSLHQPLRYGENPHQAAGLYRSLGQPELGGAQVLGGKALSYNNLIDADAAVALCAEFELPAVAIIKHTNPAGCACAIEGVEAAYEEALRADAKSAFGGIVALNRPVSAALAERMVEHFYEVIAAPGFEPAALAILEQKKALRLIALPQTLRWPALTSRATLFGTLIQQRDVASSLDEAQWRCVTKVEPSPQQLESLKFAWQVCKHVKSNAIVLAQGQRTLGVGAGQMSRVDAVEIALQKALQDVRGASLASDAFFPFRDSVDLVAGAGVSAIIQPGGSKRDQEVIDACDEHGISMIFTGVRHFRH